jgi:hypothetical protein
MQDNIPHPIIQWLIEGSLWEFCAAVVLTIMARIFTSLYKVRWEHKHELRFWGTGIVGLTILLLILNYGVIRPFQQRFSSQPHPRLHCSFKSGIVAAAYNGSQPSIFYQLKIVNSGGQQSIAWKWNLKIILTTGQLISADAAETPFNQTFFNPDTKQQISQFDNSGYLPNLLLENPIQSGAGKTGWVVFSVNSADQNDLTRIGNKFILTFQDCEGNESAITNVIVEKGGILAK